MPVSWPSPLDLAEQADRISRRYFRSTDLRVDQKADASPVSEADTAIEQAIRQRVGETYPDDAVLGEEYGASQPGARRRWIVDPIDGTRKFVRGLPGFGTLLALEVDGEVVVGVASAPALERRWWAARGQGAFANGAPIHVSERIGLAAAHIAHGSIEGWVQIGRLAGLAALAARSWGTSGYADFWIHMLVAEGAAEAAVEAQAAIWDVAALALIVEEAGGRFTDVDGARTITGGSAHQQQRPRARGGRARRCAVRCPERQLAASRLFRGALRQAAEIASGLIPYCARSGPVGPTSANSSGMPTMRIRVGCSTASSSAIAPPRPPVRWCSSAETMPRVSAAARRIASRSIGLIEYMLTTRACTPSVASASDARSAISTMQPQATIATSLPERSSAEPPITKGAAGSETAGSFDRPPSRT